MCDMKDNKNCQTSVVKQNIINTEQSEYWNKKSGPKWVKVDKPLNERFSILTNELFVRANIKKNDKVLDIGCGSGETSFRASKLVGNNGKVTGADISETLLNYANSKFFTINNLDFTVCDAQNYKFETNNFDKVISRFGVMFFENPIDAFANIKLSMKTNGSLNFVCWSNMKENDFFFEGLEMIAKCTKQNLSPITKNPGPFAFSEKSYIEKILKKSGFQDIQIDTVYTNIYTKDSVEKDVEMMLNIGPRAQMLSEANLSNEKMLIIRKNIKKLCKTKQNKGEIKYKACLNYVSAIK